MWDDVPDRPFVVLQGQTCAARDIDLVSLVVAEQHDPRGLGLEEGQILTQAVRPIAVVELSAHLRMPVGMVCVLLSGLVDRGYITIRHPHDHGAPATGLSWQPPSSELLERVLDGLRKHPA